MALPEGLRILAASLPLVALAGLLPVLLSQEQ
jgi:hypothetical protein